MIYKTLIIKGNHFYFIVKFQKKYLYTNDLNLADNSIFVVFILSSLFFYLNNNYICIEKNNKYNDNTTT